MKQKQIEDEQKTEQKSDALIDLFVEEYRALKEENENLKREVEELKEDSSRAISQTIDYRGALKALNIKMDENGYIMIQNCFFSKSDGGYDYLKKFIGSLYKYE